MSETRESTHPLDLDYIRTNIPCQWACPARTDVPAYIDAIAHGKYAESYQINRGANLFPAVLGRVCSRPCEDFCRHGDSDLGDSVGICHLKRVAADHAPRDYTLSEHMFAPTGKSVGIVGGGPAGLAAAYTLALFGHRVTVYEAMPKLGGMLLYGIPDFRVPPEIVDEEVFNIVRLGVQVQTGVRLGVDMDLAELRAAHNAVILAIGCYSSNRLRVEGENLEGCESGLEFMMRVNEGNPPSIGKRVAVIGGGFTAMDCARSALRLGAEEVTIHIRKTEEDLKVTREELLEAKREGVLVHSLVQSAAILGNTRVEGIRFLRTRLDEVAGKRKKPVVIEKSDFEIPADTVIVAVGQRPERTFAWKGLEGPVEVAELTGETGLKGVYLAGDFLGGASTVIEAIGHARGVANRVDGFLMGRMRREAVVRVQPSRDTRRKRAWDFIPRIEMPTLPIAKRLSKADAEVEEGLGREEGTSEARRCYLCHLRYEVHVPDCIYCRWCIDLCPRECIHLTEEVEAPREARRGGLKKTGKWNRSAAVVIDSDRCIRCGECLRICPTQCIHVTRVTLGERLVLQREEGRG